MEADLHWIYKISEDVSVKEVNDGLVIIPLVDGIAGEGEELFVLNETARAVWERFDGKTAMKEIIDSLSQIYDAPVDEITAQSLALADELLKRRMIYPFS